VESFFLVLAVVVFVALFALFAYYAYQRQQMRIAEMTALAGRLAWRFDSSRDSSHQEEYPQFAAFRRGHSRYAYNALRGTVQISGKVCAAKMGDYHFCVTSGAGKTRSTRTYTFSYLIVHLPFARVPSLCIRGEGIFDTLAGALGFEDIDFESAEFSKRFHVKSADKRFAYDVVHPGMMEYLLASGPPTIDIELGCCCMFDGEDTCWSPAEFEDRLRWAHEFFDIWPRHLVASLNSA
jgi:hypothetical protein